MKTWKPSRLPHHKHLRSRYVPQSRAVCWHRRLIFFGSGICPTSDKNPYNGNNPKNVLKRYMYHRSRLQLFCCNHTASKIGRPSSAYILAQNRRPCNYSVMPDRIASDASCAGMRNAFTILQYSFTVRFSGSLLRLDHVLPEHPMMFPINSSSKPLWRCQSHNIRLIFFRL